MSIYYQDDLVTSREHGTTARYVIDFCRCDDCTTASRDYAREVRRRQAYGVWKPYVDAKPARAHIKALQKAGMGPKTIAKQSGLPHGTIASIRYGKWIKPGKTRKVKRVRPETEQAILSVQADVTTLAAGRYINAGPTRRRIQALLWLGWSYSEQGRRLGINPTNMVNVAQTRDMVHVKTARKVATLYDELRWTLGPSSRSKNLADKKGFHPPIAWDDIDTDTRPGNEHGGVKQVGYDRPSVEAYIASRHRRKQMITRGYAA